MGKVGKFYKSITDESFMGHYLDVEYYYKVDYWVTSGDLKVYENISGEKFVNRKLGEERSSIDLSLTGTFILHYRRRYRNEVDIE
ncbi:hypothetical protein MKY34_15880 [Sporosarcina sp. FSL K6-1522]|uniref:hypothetical protein n=1 Tax=Sporosarcina sp. FSL K6-1522 TaxID=2921554 RepID=UPI003159A234